MPWTQRDVPKHTKKAKTKAQKHHWVRVANRVLRETGDEGRAIRIANAAVSGRKRKKRIKQHRWPE